MANLHPPQGRESLGPGGLEPPTPRLSSACSNQLSYEPGNCRGAVRELRLAGRGFAVRSARPVSIPRNAELSRGSLWSLTRRQRLEPDGFEPTTPCLQSRCSAS